MARAQPGAADDAITSDVRQRPRHHSRSLAIEDCPELSAIVVGHYEQEIDFLVRIEGLIDTGGYPLDVLLGNLCPDLEDQKAGSGRGLLNDRFGVCRPLSLGGPCVCTPTNRQILLQFRQPGVPHQSEQFSIWGLLAGDATGLAERLRRTFGLQAVVT